MNVEIGNGGSFWAALAAFLAIILVAIYEFFSMWLGDKNKSGGRADSGAFTLDDLAAAAGRSCTTDQDNAQFKTAWDLREHEPVETLEDLEKLGWRIKYQGTCRRRRLTTHNGQIKLGMSEVRLLTDETDPYADADPKLAGDYTVMMVYAGAAPSNKHGLLCKMFPRVKFLLVDPNPFDLHWVPAGASIVIHKGQEGNFDGAQLLSMAMRSGTQTVIINDLFTQDLAEALGRDYPGCIFVSDIRTNMYKPTGGADFIAGVAEGGSVRQGKFAVTGEPGPNQHGAAPDAADILWNYAQQFNWCRAMRPRACMTKFRHPFYSDPDEVVEAAFDSPLISAEFAKALEEINGVAGIDFRANYREKKLVWFDGVVDIQMFAPVSSTETRLRFDARKTKDWGTTHDYEDHFFAFNNVYRWVGHFRNDSAAASLGYDHCADCALVDISLRRYLTKFGAGWHGRGGGGFWGGSDQPLITDPDRMKLECRRIVVAFCTITGRSLFRDGHGYFGFHPSADNPGLDLEIVVPAFEAANRIDSRDVNIPSRPDKKWADVAAGLPADVTVRGQDSGRGAHGNRGRGRGDSHRGHRNNGRGRR